MAHKPLNWHPLFDHPLDYLSNSGNPIATPSGEPVRIHQTMRCVFLITVGDVDPHQSLPTFSDVFALCFELLRLEVGVMTPS